MDFLEAAGDAPSGNFDPFDANDDFDRLAPVTGGRHRLRFKDIAEQIPYRSISAHTSIPSLMRPVRTVTPRRNSVRSVLSACARN